MNVLSSMKAVLVHKPYGDENVTVSEIPDPSPKKGEVLIGIRYAVLNPVDVNTIRNKTVYGLKWDPHIPGAEVFGVSQTDGEKIRKGERVVVYPRWSDGTCKFCRSGREYLCESGGIFGVFSSGGFCETISVPEKMVVKVPETIKDEDAVSLTVGGLTAYHALKMARATSDESLLVYGASGNTGVYAVLLGKELGMAVYAVSSKDWVAGFGADQVFRSDEIPADLKTDVVVNSLGGTVFSDSLNHVNRGGRIVTFGVFTGANTEINLGRIYPNEVQILGSTGGSLAELKELISIMEKSGKSMPTHHVYKFDQIRDAISEFPKRTKGRILLTP